MNHAQWNIFKFANFNSIKVNGYIFHFQFNPQFHGCYISQQCFILKAVTGSITLNSGPLHTDELPLFHIISMEGQQAHAREHESPAWTPV